jgi:preprotein translocase subunit SecD
MGKRFVYTGLIVLCALSYANGADLPSEEAVAVEFKLVCAGAGQVDCRKLAKRVNQEELHVTTEAFLSTKDIVSAKAKEESGDIDFQFNKEGSQKLNEITSKNAGRRMAIFVDGNLLSTPKIYDPVVSGKITIPSGLDKEKAQALAGRINKTITKKSVVGSSYLK